MKSITKKLRCAVAVLLAVSATGKATATVDIKLRERVAPATSVVRLGDVAEISTDDRQQARQLAGLRLMPAPTPGTERFLRRREIQDLLAGQGFEVGELRFGGAEQVAIAAAGEARTSGNVNKTSSTIIVPMNRHTAILAGARDERPAPLDEARANELRQQLNGIIAKYLNAKIGKAESWKIECDVAERELAKLCAATTAPVCQGGSEPWTGRQRFLLSFSTAEGTVQVPIFADVAPPPVPVVMAVRPIARGDVIKAADIELRTVEATPKVTGQRAAADSVEKLIGMESRQPIAAGEIVFADQLQSPVLVKRGDVITVTSQSGGIRVRTSARALHDGARGVLVQVESLGSRQKYDARVVGPREAAVFAMSRPAAPEPVKRVNTARRQTFPPRRHDEHDE